MYRSEMASWYGTDIMVERMKGRESEIGGYFSYTDGDNAVCVFFTKGENAQVLGMVTFDTSYSVEKAKVDMASRDFTDGEKQLYTIRQRAVDEVKSDTFFRKYTNTSLNFIPIIHNGERKVYILTGPEKENVIIFGNDYELIFDNKNNLKSKRRIHQNLITTDMTKGKDMKDIFGIHNHLPATGSYITSTDVCTLMLYARFSGMKNYYVLSKDYVSLWSCEHNSLAVITRKAWDNISKDQEKRHPRDSK
jgi:hypothetical protein